MIVVWTILSLLGLVVAIWYIKSTVLNRHGRINYPMLLWKKRGHYFSWFLILLGGFSVYMLYGLIPDAMMMVFKIAGGLLILSILIKIGLATGVLPYLLIFIFALVGLIKGGFRGFIVGIVLGYVFNFVIGLASFPIAKLFDIGMVKKKYRIKLAKDFFAQNEKEILAVDSFANMKEEKIIVFLGSAINQIYSESRQLRKPYKRHDFDSDYSGYKPSFIEGSKNWLNKFKNEYERGLMQRYLDFLVSALYEEYGKYI
jgi:hypothetical protein